LEVGTEEVGSLEVGTVEGGFLEVGTVEVGFLEEGSVEEGSLEEGSWEAGSLEVGSLEVGFLEVGFLEVGSLEVGSSEVGSFKDGLSEVGSLEVGLMKIEASTVFLWYSILCAAENIQDSLDVSSRTAGLWLSRLLRPFIRFGGGFVRRRSRVRGSVGGPRRLSRVLPNVSCKDFHNRAVVPLWRVPCDPFKGIDAAQAYLNPWSAIVKSGPELVDSPREALRDLPLLGKPLGFFLAFTGLLQLIPGALPSLLQLSFGILPSQFLALPRKVESAKTSERCE